RLVDHRGADHAAEAAEIRDREGTTGDFIRLELARAGPPGGSHDGALQVQHALFFGAAYYGDDQAILPRHRDPDVDVVVVDDVVVIQRRVEQGILTQRDDTGPRDERQVGQRETIIGLELRLVTLAHLRHLGHIDAMHGGHVRRGALGHDHV